MSITQVLVRAVASAMPVALAGCAATDGARRGALSATAPTKLASLDAAALRTLMETPAPDAEGPTILKHAGAPACGVDVYRFEYHTVGARGEPTTASAALLVPTGSAAACKGPRPTLLHAHGTVVDRGYNLATVPGLATPEARFTLRMAGLFAGQGYIVITPNYAGLDTSPLPYHPYYNADQQSKDMIDALAAARALLPRLSVQASDQLFLSGYSQGGFVAMATHRAMQALGMKVTASAPMSGGYTVGVAADAAFMGRPGLSATTFIPLLMNSYQNAYGDVVGDPKQVFSAQYAPGMPGLLPSTTPLPTLLQEGRLPAEVLFSDKPPTAPAAAEPTLQAKLNAMTPAAASPLLAPVFAKGFGANPLLTNEFRLDYMRDVMANRDGASPVFTTGEPPRQSANGFRRALYRNDLRGWTPRSPVMMCGGHDDPMTSFPDDAEVMLKYWSAPSPMAAPQGMVSLLDIDSSPAANDPYAALKRDFAERRAKAVADNRMGVFWVEYHPVHLAVLCHVAAQQFFQSMR